MPELDDDEDDEGDDGENGEGDEAFAANHKYFAVECFTQFAVRFLLFASSF